MFKSVPLFSVITRSPRRSFHSSWNMACAFQSSGPTRSNNGQVPTNRLRFADVFMNLFNRMKING